jgi:hypothetical protein
MSLQTQRFIMAAALLGAACDGPEDGVLRIAFLLEPPPPAETRVVPPEAETGVPVAQLGAARGRCDADVVAGRARCSFEGLPPAAPGAGRPLAYELRFLLWYGPLPARFDARALDRDPGGRDPDAPPPPMAAPLPRTPGSPVSPDPFGKAERTFGRAEIPLERLAGAELRVIVPREGAEPARYVVIDGRVGNLPAPETPGAPAPAAPIGGGHQH